MPPADPPRDRYGRPLIVPPNGGTPVAYTRASTVGKALSDDAALAGWRQRMTALGLAARPDLLARVATTDVEDRATLDRLTSDAVEAAAASAAANMGPAVHAATELLDTGTPLPAHLPHDVRASVDAYAATLAAVGVVAESVERFTVCDAVMAAGTYDRLYRLPDGRLVVGDVKTSRHGVRYGAPGWMCQLAVYANGVHYDVDTAQRTPMPADLDRTVGLIVVVPVGGPTASLFTVDLVAGWRAVQVARWVREYRKSGAVPYAGVA